MSLSLDEAIPVVRVYDPSIKFLDNSDQKVAVVTGSSQTTYKQVFSSNSASQTSQTFDATIPSYSFLGKRIFVVFDIEVSITGTNRFSPVSLVDSGSFAPRFLPLTTGLIQTGQLTLGNSIFSVNFNNVMPALAHMNAEHHKLNGKLSISPNMIDNAQNYNLLYDTNKNVLAWQPGDNVYNESRGSFGVLMGTSSNPVNTVPTDVRTATFTYRFTEEVAISPLIWAQINDEVGFYNIDKITLQLQFNNINNCFSRVQAPFNPAAPVATANELKLMNPIPTEFGAINTSNTSITIASSTLVGSPYMMIKIDTPPLLERPPIGLLQRHPYYEYNTYFSATYQLPRLTLNATANSVLQNVNTQTLHTIPSLILLYVRPLISDYGSVINMSQPQTFAGIRNLRLQWNNSPLQLNTLDSQQLYLMSRENGVDMTWNEWSGLNEGMPIGTFADPSTTRGAFFPNCKGSLLAIRPGKDFSLLVDEAPGMTGNFSLFIQADTYNVDPIPYGDGVTANYVPKNYQLCYTCITEGQFVIENGKTYTQIGLLTPSDVLRASSAPQISMADVNAEAGGALRKLGTSLRTIHHSKLEHKMKAHPHVMPHSGMHAASMGGKRGRKRSSKARGGSEAGYNLLIGGAIPEDEQFDEDDEIEGGRYISRESLRQHNY